MKCCAHIKHLKIIFSTSRKIHGSLSKIRIIHKETFTPEGNFSHSPNINYDKEPEIYIPYLLREHLITVH